MSENGQPGQSVPPPIIPGSPATGGTGPGTGPSASSQPGGQTSSPHSAQASAPSAGSFDFNRPTIVSLLYLSSCVLGVTVLVGIVLAYIWKNEPHSDWEDTHYRYLIRTFWLGLIGTIIGTLLLIVLVGFLVWLAVGVLVVVRCVLSLINAQKQQPMPNPDTWLA